MTLIKLSEESEENVCDVMVRDFLTSSQQHLNLATDPDAPEADFRSNCIAAQLCGMVAYLLDQINQMDSGVGPDVAWELHDWCQDGEPLAQWVADELHNRGVDVESLAATRAKV